MALPVFRSVHMSVHCWVKVNTLQCYHLNCEHETLTHRDANWIYFNVTILTVYTNVFNNLEFVYMWIHFNVTNFIFRYKSLNTVNTFKYIPVWMVVHLSTRPVRLGWTRFAAAIYHHMMSYGLGGVGLEPDCVHKFIGVWYYRSYVYWLTMSMTNITHIVMMSWSSYVKHNK